jgi:hypothetical protein
MIYEGITYLLCFFVDHYLLRITQLIAEIDANLFHQYLIGDIPRVSLPMVGVMVRGRWLSSV